MNKKVKVLIVGGVAALALGTGAGVVVAQTDDPVGHTAGTCSMHTADMDEMHAQMQSHMGDMGDMGGMGDTGGMHMGDTGDADSTTD
jgi:hypothetical protein